MIMKIKIVILVYAFSVGATTMSAQTRYASTRTIPCETEFEHNNALFSEFLSGFPTIYQQYDTLWQAVWFNNPNKVPVDNKYKKMLMAVPFFDIYQAFRIDCTNGYILGIYNTLSIYNIQIETQSFVSYLDILTYTSKGELTSRLSLALNYIKSYFTDNSMILQKYQLIGGVDIMNSEVHYGYDQRWFANREPITHSISKYIYTKFTMTQLSNYYQKSI